MKVSCQGRSAAFEIGPENGSDVDEYERHNLQEMFGKSCLSPFVGSDHDIAHAAISVGFNPAYKGRSNRARTNLDL